MLQKLTKPSIYIYLVYTVVLFVMALIFATGLESIMTQDNSVPKAILDSREAIQKANNAVFYLFVGGIVGVILLFIFGNSYRKKLYMSNLIAGTVVPLATIVGSVIVLVFISKAISTYNENLDGIKEYYETSLFGASTPVETLIYPAIALVLVIIYIALCALYITYTILKYRKSVMER